MRRHARPGVLASVVLMLTVLAGFATPSYAQDLKLAFVNVPKVLDKAPQALAAQQRIKEEFATRDQELLQRQKRIRNLEDEIVRRAAEITGPG